MWTKLPLPGPSQVPLGDYAGFEQPRPVEMDRPYCTGYFV